MKKATKKTATKSTNVAPIYEDIDASPVKSFFVNMLTRDIRIEEAILDLLDNCIDGVLRNQTRTPKVSKPYQGFWAKITFSGSSFQIEDNCGGIPWDLHDYAFRMGRPMERGEDTSGTVGIYGIGMKRAIFKIGQNATISTQHKSDRYDVDITAKWISDELNWHLPVVKGKVRSHDGTLIAVTKLNRQIADRFADKEVFEKDLYDIIATHYSFIIDKGFKVTINNTLVAPVPTKLSFDTKASKNHPAVKPFIWRTRTKEGVEVYLSVGFTRPIPSSIDVDQDQANGKYSSVAAGWTILCNDRAVVYCDRTELTGWGEAGVPRYHNQFIAISGIVEFRCDDASKLPTTTTKRGIDASSRLYLQIKNKMREGTNIFVDYTNKWKGMAEESKVHIRSDAALSFDEIKLEAKSLKFSKSKASSIEGLQYTPTLPLPMMPANEKRISFTKKIKDIKKVSEYLFEDAEVSPSEVGEKCFDILFKEAK